MIPQKNTRRKTTAFSLVELLTVVAVISVLITLVSPAISSILGTKGVGRALADVSSLLELAKTEAMSRKTYVFVGLENTVDASGNPELMMAAVASLDGSAITGDNLVPLTRLVRVPNVAQVNYSDLPQSVQSITDANQDSEYVIDMSASDVSFQVGPQTFDAAMLIISPEGELLPSVNDPVFLSRAHVGVVQMRGTQPSDHDGGIVTFDGGSGAIKVIRP